MNTQTTIPEFQISMKYKRSPVELMRVRDSKDVADVARLCFDADTIEWVESMLVIALNQHNKVMGFYKVGQGGITGTVCYPRVIYQFALLASATSLVIAHNHPSGNLNPSQADIHLTDKIKRAGELLDIKLLDHVIVTSDSYYSFADNGQLI